MTYRTFLRSATSWESFAKARKITQGSGLSAEDARETCRLFNDSRTAAQVRRGTKLEFERE